jgi:hypothetical protein
MNLDAIAKRIAHEESLPGRRATRIGLNTGSLQARSQAIHVRTLKTKMPLDVYSTALLLYRNMNIQSASVKPHPTLNSKWLRL